MDYQHLENGLKGLSKDQKLFFLRMHTLEIRLADIARRVTSLETAVRELKRAAVPPATV